MSSPGPEEICGAGFASEFFRPGVPSAVGEALQIAWQHEGAIEIGCPRLVEAKKHHVYVVKSIGGESNPSLVLSDDKGNAHVVFEQLVSLLDRLIQSGMLRYVDGRVPAGVGDYQVVHLAHGTCRLAIRPSYRDDYVKLSPAATSVFMGLALREARFLSIDEIRQGRKTTIYEVGYADDSSYARPEFTLVSDRRRDRAWLRNSPAAPAGPHTECPATDLFDALAGRLAGP